MGYALSRALPEALLALNRELYPRLLPIACDWWTKLGRDAPWPTVINSSDPGMDYSGGEFILCERRRRA